MVSKLLTFIMFVDDTNIFISGHNLDNLILTLNSEVVNDWFSANLLSSNIKKTNYIIFGNKKINDIPVTISREQINRVNETEFLGVIIQASLKWNAHIKVIQNKIS